MQQRPLQINLGGGALTAQSWAMAAAFPPLPQDTDHTGLTHTQTSISTALHRGVSNELIGRKGLWLSETDARGTFYSGKL